MSNLKNVLNSIQRDLKETDPRASLVKIEQHRGRAMNMAAPDAKIVNNYLDGLRANALQMKKESALAFINKSIMRV